MKIAMLFPGYGSQYVGMAKELYDESRLVQEYFEEASNCLNTNFVKLCFASSDIELAKMSNAYTSIFLVSSALFRLLQEEGIKPDVVAGYNLGEYSAIYAAGGFSFPDGLYLLNKFASFYQEALEGAEVAIIHVRGVATKELEDYCFKAIEGNNVVRIIMYNTETDHIIAGSAQAVEYVRQWVTQQHPDAVFDDVSIEFGLHSSLMDDVVKNFEIYLSKVDFKDVQVPILSGIDTQLITSGPDIKTHVIEHLRNPIVWNRVMDHLADYDVLVEVGPGTALSAIAKEKYPDKLIYAINKRSDIDALKKILMPLTVETEQKSDAEKPS